MLIISSFGKNIFIGDQCIGYIDDNALYINRKKFADITDDGVISINNREVGYVDDDGSIIVNDKEVGYIDINNNFVFNKTLMNIIK
jgi:hypothetical protein